VRQIEFDTLNIVVNNARKLTHFSLLVKGKRQLLQVVYHSRTYRKQRGIRALVRFPQSQRVKDHVFMVNWGLKNDT
jgi:hypothetical protein